MESPHVTARPALVDGVRRYYLNSAGSTLIGRQGCAILIAGDQIAPQHARVVPGRGGFSIEPIGGPVAVNDTTITVSMMLTPGDSVKIGTVTLVRGSWS